MATHSSMLAWEIPWTEEPDGLQSMGSQRAGHDLGTKQPPPAPPLAASALEWLRYIKLLWTLTHTSLCGHAFSFLIGKYLGVGWQNHILSLTWKETALLFPRVAAPLCIPISSVWSSSCSTSLSALSIVSFCCYLLCFSHSGSLNVELCCAFTLHFPDDW